MSRDSQPAARVREGLLQDDPDATETVRGWVAAMVFGAGWQLDDPDAAVQDITLRVLHLGRSGRIRRDTDFKSFVLTVARHTCTDIYRRERLRGAIEAPEVSPDRWPADTGNPEERFEACERRELVRFLLQGLPDECRRLLRWVHGDGLKAAEVARRLGISVANARVRTHRCLARARRLHEDYALGAAVPTGGKGA